MKYAFLICFFLLSFFGKAQEQLTLLECVNIAIENSLNLNQAELELRSAEADYKQSKLSYLPSLNGSLSSGLGFGRSLDYTTYEFNTQTTQSNSFGFSASAPLFQGGQVRQSVYLQSLMRDRSETNIKSVKDDIAIAVANSFLQAVTAREQISVADTQVKMRKLDVERTQKLIDAGVSAGSLAVDMKAQLANANFQKQQAENQYQMALLNLKQTMLYPFEKQIELIEPDIAFPSHKYLQDELSPELVLAGALNNLGSMQLVNQDIEIAKTNKKLAESQLYPSIGISGGVNSYHSDQARKVTGTGPQGPIFANKYSIFEQWKDNISQNLGLSVSFPIFNRGQVKNQIRKADINIERAKVGQKVQEQQLAQTIQNSYMQADLAYRSFEVAQSQVESLEKAAEFAKKRYDLGTASIYDYFTAQNNLANAQIQLAQAKYDYLFKIKVLEFYKDNQFELTK